MALGRSSHSGVVSEVGAGYFQSSSYISLSTLIRAQLSSPCTCSAERSLREGGTAGRGDGQRPRRWEDSQQQRPHRTLMEISPTIRGRNTTSSPSQLCLPFTSILPFSFHLCRPYFMKIWGEDSKRPLCTPVLPCLPYANSQVNKAATIPPPLPAPAPALTVVSSSPWAGGGGWGDTDDR